MIGKNTFPRALCTPAALAGGAAFLLGMSGLMTIASSRSALVEQPDPLLLKQVFFLVAGLAVMFAATAVPFRTYRKYAGVFGVCGLLSLFMLPLFGVSINGMRGWLHIGALSLQPSELMKAPFVLVLAVIFARREQPEYWRFGWGFFWTVMWLLPVAKQPDFGTASIYFGVFMIFYIASGGRFRYLAAPVALGGAAAAWFVFRHPYALRRLGAFINPEGDPLGSGWHARQFELAIARGHLFGAKLGGALWSNNYLPFSYNDSAFATLLETLGLAGGVLIGMTLAVLAAALWRLGASPGVPTVNRLFIVGAMLLLVFQSIVHISVNLCLLPTTGLTMPFVSYGGSSLAGCFLLLGMAFSAGRERENRKG